MELSSTIVTLGTIRPEDSAKGHSVPALNCIAKPKSPTVWPCLGVNPLDMPRITRHALSP